MKKAICAAMIAAGFLALQNSCAWAAEEILVGIAAESGEASSQLRAYVEQLSREEKAGQMLLVSPAQLCESGDWKTEMNTVLQNVDTYHIGGLVFLAEDLTDPEAVKELTAELREKEGIPVLIAAVPSGSRAEGLAAPEPGEEAVAETGELVSGEEAVWAYRTEQTPSEELEEMGIQCSMEPGTGTDLMVVTNAKVKNPMDDGRPASMSRSMVASTLKQTFGGVIMTDSLSTREAGETYGADMAAIYALQAGADLLTAPANPVSTYYGILSAVDEQQVTEEQIDLSVTRILELKTKLGCM